MISEKEVLQIAKLARLGLTKSEVKKFKRELSKILDYIEKLKEVDIKDVEPMSHSIKMENIMREDEKSSKFKVQSPKLMELAPETKNGYLKVKKII